MYDRNPLEPKPKTTAQDDATEKLPVAILALGAAFVASLIVGLNIG